VPITLPVVDQFIHPAIGLLSRAIIPGLFSGDGSLTPPQNPIIALTYGLTWSFFTVPPGLGYTVGNPNVYRDGLLQLASTYALADGHIVTLQVEWMRTDGGCYLWNEPLPDSVLYHIWPGLEVVFEWLQT